MTDIILAYSLGFSYKSVTDQGTKYQIFAQR